MPEVAGALGAFSQMDPRPYIGSAVSEMQEADNPLTRALGNTLGAIGEIPSFEYLDFSTGVGQQIHEGVPRLLEEVQSGARGLYDATLGSQYARSQMQLRANRNERMRQLSIEKGYGGLFLPPQRQRIEDQPWYSQDYRPMGFYESHPELFPGGRTSLYGNGARTSNSLYGR